MHPSAACYTYTLRILALSGSYQISLVIGFALDGQLRCRYLAVDAKGETVKLYEKFGFGYWIKNKRRMFLNMKDVAQKI